MNLTTDDWIPIVWNDGKAGMVSLRDAFEHGEDIRDLAVRPHERIALMRLLICIAQAALDGPADYDDWRACGPRIAPKTLDYLDRWRCAFELFGAGQRFLQVAELKKPPKQPLKESTEEDDEGNQPSKLDLALATGNNTTLFDNSGGSDRVFFSGQLALMLTAFQCFSPGGRIGVALWCREETRGKGSSEHSPCMAGGMLHTLLRDDNVIATLQKNLLHKHQAEQVFGQNSWGKPVWEAMPQSLDDADAVRNANRTYLGRLVPLARAIRLADDGQSLVLANGLEYASYADGWREPSATIVIRTVRGQPTRVVLPASIEKAAWRELHALTVKSVGQNPGGPVALQNQNLYNDDSPFDLWVGGLVANKAKPVDTVESVFHVPAAMLTKTGQMAYEKGVRHAEIWERRLRHAVEIYRLAMETSESAYKELEGRFRKLKKPEKQRLGGISSKASSNYWTLIERQLEPLYEFALEPIPTRDGKIQYHETEWGKHVCRIAGDSYERACPRQTPRQIRAYALGLSALFAPAKQAEDETRSDEETEKEAEA